MSFWKPYGKIVFRLWGNALTAADEPLRVSPV